MMKVDPAADRVVLSDTIANSVIEEVGVALGVGRERDAVLLRAIEGIDRIEVESEMKLFCRPQSVHHDRRHCYCSFASSS
eukprot:6983832-Pyramimonas_sp.AAC.1